MNGFDRQAEYWNGVATQKNCTHPLEVERLRALVPGSARLLDYGCGYGRVCAELAELGYRNVVGVDISKAMIERGLAQFSHLDLRLCGSLPLPFEASTFDVCIAFAVLTCIPSDSGQRELLAEFSRLLRPNGLLYISDYPLQLDERNQARYRQFAPEFETYGVFRVPDGGVARHHNMDWIMELLAGFSMVHQREIDTVTMNGHPAKVFQIMARKR